MNPRQREAVDHINGPLLVVAGPGTGKTEILGLRVANILRRTDTYPRNILCLTFTNSASHNMRERLSALIGNDAYKVAIHTFHSFGVEIISDYPEYFYRGTTFSPIDDLGQIEVIEEIIDDLPYDDSLRTMHPEGGYAYIKSVKEAVGNLKQAGLTPEEFRIILERNKLCYEYLNPQINSVFTQRIVKRSIGFVASLVENLSSGNTVDIAFRDIKTVTEVVRHSLTNILEYAERSAKTKPISGWKSEYTKKDDNGNLVLKDYLYSDKLFSLAYVYEEYQKRMYGKRYYDFDDMILQAIQGIQKNNSLRYELNERYEYILVDEFQDTNDAQMRLLRLITIYDEDREPNVMAVGDDDQAIYKFQGAELSNVLNFQKIYPNTKVVTITSNYRSTQEVLDLARFIITKGEQRLENSYPEIDKNIVSSNESVASGDIVSKSFPTNLHEYFWVGCEINRLIQTGKSPSDIAVIARNHRQLEEIALFLNKMEIPLTYERHNDVLREPHVRQLIQISRFVSSLCRKNKEEADEYLPEILSYPFWKINRRIIWEIAKKAAKTRVNWLEVMESYPDENIKRVADFLIQVGKESSSETVEHILYRIMGANEDLIPDNEEDDEEEITDAVSRGKFVSPFKDYYFGRDKLEGNRVEYIRFLSGLRAFIHELRDYRKEELLKIEDLLKFVNLHEKNNVPIIDNSFFVNADNSVSLLTAHKAKGQEFDTVFVINCQEEIWTGKGRGSLLPFPINLPITPAGDTLDDQLRLFYVAVTRAKSNLYLTSYETKENGDTSSRLHFILHPGENEESGFELKEVLSVDREKVDISEMPDRGDVLTASWESYHAPPVVHDERAVFEKTLEEYKLSVTHLNNFLNVSKGGPRLFFEQNLLRFPQSKTPAGSYGSAIHRTMEAIYKYLKLAGELPTLEMVLNGYERELALERLSQKHFNEYLKRGRDRLTLFYERKIENFHLSHYSEVDFSNQGVVVGNAHLTGKIDKMVPLDEKEISVHDFKTGKPRTNWKGRSRYEKIQLHQYRRQLVFYKLLVEHSKDYGGKHRVNRGVLEFIEPEKGELLDLPAQIEKEEHERTAQLASIVFDKIRKLDFPDVSRYGNDLNGIMNFEDDLLEGKV